MSKAAKIETLLMIDYYPAQFCGHAAILGECPDLDLKKIENAEEWPEGELEKSLELMMQKYGKRNCN